MPRYDVISVSLLISSLWSLGYCCDEIEGVLDEIDGGGGSSADQERGGGQARRVLPFRCVQKSADIFLEISFKFLVPILLQFQVSSAHSVIFCDSNVGCKSFIFLRIQSSKRRRPPGRLFWSGVYVFSTAFSK